MKHNSLKKAQRFFNSILIFALIFPAHILSATLDNTPPSIALEQFLSDDDYETILNNPALDYAFIPPQVRAALRTLCSQFPETEIAAAIDTFLHTTKTIAAYEDAQAIIERTASFLETLNETSAEYTIITEYARDVISGDALILMEPSDEHLESIRSCHTKTYCNLTVNNMLKTRWLSVCGNALINGDLIVNGNISGNIPTPETNLTFITENGNATSSGNTITVLGTPNIITSGAGSTITIGIDDTTNNAVQIGNVAGGLTSLPLGTDGQVLIGATGGTPLFANITSVGGSVMIVEGPNSLNLEATGTTSPIAFITENGTAMTVAGMITFTGNPNIKTSGSGSTVTVGLDDSIVVPGTVTVNSGVIITGGGLSVIGTVTFGSLGAGVLSTNASGVVSANATTNHAVQIGNASGNLTSIPVGTNGQVLIAATGADPAFATLTSNNGSITFTPGANSLNLEATTTSIITFTTNSGSATTASGIANILGGSNINTAGAGNTVTVNLNNSVSVPGSITAGSGLIATGGGLSVIGTVTFGSLGAGVLSTNASGVVSANATTNHAVQIGNASGNLTSIPVGTNGQVLIAATGADPAFATLTSNNGTITFTPGVNSLDLAATNTVSAVTFITENGTATTLNSMITFTGNPNIKTSGSGSTVTIGLDDSIVVPGTVTVNSGVIITGGGLSVIGTVTFGSLGAGVLSTNASGVVSANATTDHAVQIGNASGNLTSIPVGTNGQVLIAATGADPAFAALTSNNGSITFTPGVNSLNLEATTTSIITFTTNSGSATTTSGIANILGGSNINTAGAGNTITVNLNNSVSVPGSITAGAGLIATGGGLSVIGTVTFGSLGAGVLSTNASGVVSANATTNHAVQIGNASGNLTSIPVGTNGQVLIAATGADPAFATLTSNNGSITFTPGANSLNLEATSLASSVTFITENGNATTLNGMITFTGNPNIKTSGSGSTVTIGLDDSIVVPGTVTVNSGVIITGGGLSVIGTVTFGSLTAGVLSTNNVGLVSSSTTTNHAVQIGNANGNLTSIPVGTNGQVLIAATGADPAFATLTSNNGSITFTPGANSLNLEALATSTMAFGNTVRVDAVFGNDATGQRNGAPFLTITAALAAAQAGDMAWIFPGTYAESFTIPANVSVVGTSRTGVNISLSPGVATDLVTMGNSSSLSNVTLSLSSAALVQLRGIVFPGTTSATASVRNVTLTVNSTNAGAATSYGIHSNGTGTPNENTPNVELSTIVVTSAGSGTTRGILLNTSANNFNVRESTIRVSTTGGGSAIGAETNIGGSQLSLKTSSISGTTADISQTLGTIILEATDLLNSNANTLGFTARQVQSNIIWADLGALPALTNTMKVGTATPNGNEQFIYCPQSCIAKSLSVRNLTTPGTTNTFTLRKNGVNTALAVSLANPATSAINNTTTVTFAAGDSISMQSSRGGAGATETVVMVELY
jgi:hypothetical protein